MNFGYREALELYGCKVFSYLESDDAYHGHWVAKVLTPGGKIRFLRSYYGSCSGCDPLIYIQDNYHSKASMVEKINDFIEDLIEVNGFLTKEDLKINFKWDIDDEWFENAVDNL